MTEKRLDKRLRPARVIGIILFVASIVYFFTGLIGGLFTLIMFNYSGMDIVVSSHSSDPLEWIFAHFPFVFLFFAIFCVPLFFTSRALFRFKEWGRKGVVVMLFLMMLIMVFFGFAVMQHPGFAPFPVKIFQFIMILVYVSAIGVPVYFLMRKSSREGIRDHNLQKSEMAGEDTGE